MNNNNQVRLQCETLEVRDVPAALTNLFDDSFYLRTNPDVAVAVQRGLFRAEDHFRLLGEVENRQGNPLFDATYYLQQNPDVAAAVQAGLIRSAFRHYEQFGQLENRPASALFNGHDYLDDNPDVRGAVQGGATTAFSHFYQFGIFEDRHGLVGFNPGVYLDDNPDVRDIVERGLFSATEHYLYFGQIEHRDLEDDSDRRRLLLPPPGGNSSADPFVVSGTTQNSSDKQFYLFIPSRSGTVNASVQSGNGTFAKITIETSQSVEIFETEPNDGINSGSFSVQSGVSYLLRVRAPHDGPAAYTVTLDLV